MQHNKKHTKGKRSHLRRGSFSRFLERLLPEIEEGTQKRLGDARTETWLALRKQLISSFGDFQHGRDERNSGLDDLLSNALLDMDKKFKELDRD